jgi:hypothetical protein
MASAWAKPYHTHIHPRFVLVARVAGFTTFSTITLLKVHSVGVTVVITALACVKSWGRRVILPGCGGAVEKIGWWLLICRSAIFKAELPTQYSKLARNLRVFWFDLYGLLRVVGMLHTSDTTVGCVLGRPACCSVRYVLDELAN